MYVIQKNYGEVLQNYTSLKSYTPFDPEPVVNYVARLDGFSEYWQLSEPILFGAGEDFTIDIELSINYGLGGSWAVVFFGDNSSDPFRFSASKAGGNPDTLKPRISDFEPDSRIPWIDGVESRMTLSRVSGVITLSYDGQTYLFSSNVELSINSLGSLNGGGDYMQGYFKSLKVVTGGITNEINFTNKAQGATQIATLGDVNATMINYSSDVWEVDE